MRVLVATDLSEGGDLALREGAALAAAREGVLGVVHVLPQVQLLGMFTQKGVDEGSAAVLEHVRRVLGAAPEVFVDAGVDYAEIVRRAERWGADVVVLGGHGRSGPSHVFGGVAERVVRHAHCQVLVARSCASRGWVLAGTDFSDPSLEAIRVAADEARRRGARLKVVHAIGFLELEARYTLQLATPSVSDETSAWDVAGRSLEDALAKAGVDAACEILEGGAAPALVRDADAIGAELIVVGGRGLTGLSRLFLGSVAERVVRHASCSVLVARRHDEGLKAPRAA